MRSCVNEKRSGSKMQPQPSHASWTHLVLLIPPLAGVKDLSAKIATHAKDTQKTAPTASELAEQVHTEADRLG